MAQSHSFQFLGGGSTGGNYYIYIYILYIYSKEGGQGRQGRQAKCGSRYHDSACDRMNRHRTPMLANAHAQAAATTNKKYPIFYTFTI